MKKKKFFFLLGIICNLMNTVDAMAEIRLVCPMEGVWLNAVEKVWLKVVERTSLWVQDMGAETPP